MAGIPVIYVSFFIQEIQDVALLICILVIHVSFYLG